MPRPPTVTFQPDAPGSTVKEIRGRVFTMAHIQANDLYNLREAIREYQEEYPSMGYRTEVVREGVSPFHAVLRRYSSCE